ncbi:MAG: hypothetical protein LBL62_02535 [Planctomycetaceae bacterium]|nr:hypothetical protein [Planctomycetaceae bacterium]
MNQINDGKWCCFPVGVNANLTSVTAQRADCPPLSVNFRCIFVLKYKNSTEIL